MTAVVSDNALDAALQYIEDNAENLYVCSQQPTTFAEASSTYKLGVKASPTFTGPGNGDTSGRKLTVDAITDGTLTGTGTIRYIAITDDSNTELLVVVSLNAERVVDSETTFTLTAFDIEIPDPS
jgi:hypothetical protein